ncbi:MAG: hypothetical protein OXH52_14465 [Gammaproteobacteria bacterium]|nr:hypothetical protein [Gammaproteobacteria bacterium]
MRRTTIYLVIAAIGFTAAGAAVGLAAGRAGGADDAAGVVLERTGGAGDATGLVFESTGAAFAPSALGESDRTGPSNPRADLMRALAQAAPERDRAVRLAMNAWLAAEGAAAITAARDDPELGDVADRMTQLALYVYPELFVDNPALLEGTPEQAIAMAVSAISRFNPEAARAMIETHLSGSRFGGAMLSMFDQAGPDFASRPLQDPRAELESILAERGFMKRIPRLHALVTRVAADDPRAAADLLDDMPGSLVQHVIDPLVQVWSRTSPEEAARWLAEKDAQFSANGLYALAWQWGQSDLEAASAFADTLAGRKRETFLASLAEGTVLRMSNDEILTWVSRYENDPAHADMVMSVAQRLSQQDVGAAMALIETLPERERLPSYHSVVTSLAFEDPEAAIGLVDEIGNASLRDQALPIISSLWGQNDAEAALGWAIGLAPGQARDRAIASIASSLMNFDIDHAVEAINEIDDQDVRRGPVLHLLSAVDSDDDAVRLGRDFDIDRDAVLELRENRSRMPHTGFIAPSFTFSGPVSINVAGEYRDADEE